MNRLEHVLTVLGEEASEVQQAKDKILRFGMQSCAPGSSSTNMEDLIQEINEFMSVVEILREEHGIPIVLDPQRMEAKKLKLKTYMRICEEIGTIKNENP